MKRFSRIDIPQMHCLLVTTTDQKLTIGAKANGINALGIPLLSA
jgi:hypothetical protein